VFEPPLPSVRHWLLVVVNRPVLYTVQVRGGYEILLVEFCLLCGCVINNVCPSV